MSLIPFEQNLVAMSPVVTFSCHMASINCLYSVHGGFKKKEGLTMRDLAEQQGFSATAQFQSDLKIKSI